MELNEVAVTGRNIAVNSAWIGRASRVGGASASVGELVRDCVVPCRTAEQPTTLHRVSSAHSAVPNERPPTPYVIM